MSGPLPHSLNWVVRLEKCSSLAMYREGQFCSGGQPRRHLLLLPACAQCHHSIKHFLNLLWVTISHLLSHQHFRQSWPFLPGIDLGISKWPKVPQCEAFILLSYQDRSMKLPWPSCHQKIANLRMKLPLKKAEPRDEGGAEGEQEKRNRRQGE